MKKSLLALAALTAFAGAASAQSSVTIGGKMDIGVGKAIGSSDKGVIDAAGSRLNFGAVEDLGGGLKAVFGIEHRLNPDDGASSSGTNFWNGYSWAGLQGGFGRVMLGRYYTASFLNVQNQIDPFGGDTVAGLRSQALIAGGSAKVRFANGLRYDVSAGGVGFAFDISEAGKNNTGAVDGSVTKKPYSFAVTYGGGPVWVGLSYENPGNVNDKLTTLGGRFTVGGGVTLRAGVSKGTTAANTDIKNWLIGANWRAGNGDFRIGYAKANIAGGNAEAKKLGIGYHYDLSKRTKLYADFARDSVPTTNSRCDGTRGVQPSITVTTLCKAPSGTAIAQIVRNR